MLQVPREARDAVVAVINSGAEQFCGITNRKFGISEPRLGLVGSDAKPLFVKVSELRLFGIKQEFTGNGIGGGVVDIIYIDKPISARGRNLGNLVREHLTQRNKQRPNIMAVS